MVHDVVAALCRLHLEDGAGAWPPRSKREQGWPVPLRPYREIYAMMSSHFATTDPSANDDINAKRRAGFRAHMRCVLASRIDLPAVEAVSAREVTFENDSSTNVNEASFFPRNACNRFSSCIAYSRQAYQ
ncbi:hypothetical protein PG988_015435 [Apiospora saccharicola]